ncbi:MAG: GUN4 domain-containing protein [Myxacorys chilensis ATA2-1-KO14]|nr:GUN4 domain-containing protein [Myxacorys chilensis ATA2-1-KO14]
MAWLPGKKLQNGKYIIKRKLGEGGFGVTYLAQDLVKQKVVIKTLNSEIQHHRNFVKFQQDFLNEALRLAKCSHSNIVQIHEVIQEENLWCMVMEYIDGEDLANVLVSRGTLSELEALHYIKQVADALISIHSRQPPVLHRDVKPQNIVIRSKERNAVLIDFGIAREFIPNLTQQTQTQLLTEGFAPLEQYEERAERGAFTDVYALAATLYTLLTGEVPACAIERERVLLKRKVDPLKLPQQINPNITSQVSRAIVKGMALEVIDRPQTVREWLNMLISEKQLNEVAQEEKSYELNNQIKLEDAWLDTLVSREQSYKATQEKKEQLNVAQEEKVSYEVDYQTELEDIEKEKYAENQYQFGLENAKRARYIEAINNFDLALNIAPFFTKAYKFRGIAKSRIGDCSRAIKDLTKAAEVYELQEKFDNQKMLLAQIQILKQLEKLTDLETSSEWISETGIDYSSLQKLLAAANWKAADFETLDIMLGIANRDYWLTAENVSNFPSRHLLIINHLWAKHSYGKFGFSVQKRIWQSLGGNLNADFETRQKFNRHVGWSLESLVDYEFPLQLEKLVLGRALPGQFPFLVSRGCDTSRDWFLKYLLSHPAL